MSFLYLICFLYIFIIKSFISFQVFFIQNIKNNLLQTANYLFNNMTKKTNENFICGFFLKQIIWLDHASIIRGQGLGKKNHSSVW